MARKKKLSRLAVCRKLQELALKIAAGRPVRAGNRSVKVPDELEIEMEIEVEDGEYELEIELKWRKV
ncbi:MAG: amphi-Trp domain-containing protein [Deltaproteobacteria bacterium]|nr:amphi-Trp domain-containing protein [Deltaproteobacteria bacterium]